MFFYKEHELLINIDIGTIQKLYNNLDFVTFKKYIFSNLITYYNLNANIF